MALNERPCAPACFLYTVRALHGAISISVAIDMKENLNALVVFARVAQMGTFTAAAKALRMPKATVSSMVSALERQLGTALFQRTTRRVTLTEAGRVYLASCERVLEELRSGREAIDALQSMARGRLRVTAPFALSRSVLAQLLPGFQALHPELHIELHIDNTVAPVLNDDSDIWLRIGPQGGQHPGAQPITVFPTRLYASQTYLGQRQTPLHPDDLQSHALLGRAGAEGRVNWRLKRGSEEIEVSATPSISVCDPDTISSLIKQGTGIGWLPAFLARPAMAGGEFVQCLPDWDPVSVPLHALVRAPSVSGLNASALINYLRENISPWT